MANKTTVTESVDRRRHTAMAQGGSVPSGLGLPASKFLISSSFSHRHAVKLTPKSSRDPLVLCSAENPESRITRSSSSSSPSQSSTSSAVGDDERENIILKAAWYGAEALGNIVSVFSPAKDPSASFPDTSDVSRGPHSRDCVIQAIKDDYGKGYFVTGNVSSGVYEEDCEFADPAGSFKSLKRFRNNCSNFGSLLEKSDVKLVKWEELNRFIDTNKVCWNTLCNENEKFEFLFIAATGFTEYYFDPDSGRICRHAENWDVPKMVLLGQVFKPNPSFRRM